MRQLADYCRGKWCNAHKNACCHMAILLLVVDVPHFLALQMNLSHHIACRSRAMWITWICKEAIDTAQKFGVEEPLVDEASKAIAPVANHCEQIEWEISQDS